MIYVTATAKYTTTENCTIEHISSNEFRLNFDDYKTKDGLLNLYWAILYTLPQDTRSYKNCHYSIPSSSNIQNRTKFDFRLYNLEEDEVVDECHLEVKTNCDSNLKNSHTWKMEMNLFSQQHGAITHPHEIDRDLDKPYNWDEFFKSFEQSRSFLLLLKSRWQV